MMRENTGKSNTLSVKGLVVVITGAASGIGAATAIEVLSKGGVPVLVDCDEQPLAHMAQQCGQDTLYFVADVTDLNAMLDVMAQTLSVHRRIDVVFANAGVAAFGPVACVDPQAWQRCVEVNIFGVFNTVRSALPALMRQQGYVLINASVSSFAHPPAMSAYAASKAAVEAMGNVLHLELQSHGVGVGVMYAGWVRTPLVEEGALHPGFRRLRATMPPFLNKETSAQETASVIVRAISKRQRRVFVPSWLRILFGLRALLHLPFAERELIKAAPEIEKFYLEGLASEGALASSFGPRERERTLARARQNKDGVVQ
jgi:NAD(P)-dependent dehydrogenase (short-subunit alcohol dehydrogenase family)